MADTIEALLEENTSKLQELIAAAEALHQDSQRLGSFASRSGELIATVGPGAVRSLQTLDEAVRDALASFETAEESVFTRLMAGQEKVAAIEAEWDALSGELTDSIHALRNQVRETQDRVQSHHDRFDTEFEELKGNNVDFQEASSTVAEGAEDLMDELRAAITESVTRIEERRVSLTEQMSALESDAVEKLENLGNQFEEAHETTGQRVDTLLQDVDTATDKSASEIREQFADNCVEKVLAEFSALGDAFNALGSVAGEGGGDYDGAVGKIVDQIREVAELIEKIRPALELVKQLA